jgi:hypothetical protein
VSSLDFSTEETVNKGIIDWLEDSVPKAIERMFNAKREALAIDPELQKAYQ